MVHCNNQVPYHMQSILANQSASASTRLIIQQWIPHYETKLLSSAIPLHHTFRLLILVLIINAEDKATDMEPWSTL